MNSSVVVMSVRHLRKLPPSYAKPRNLTNWRNFRSPYPYMYRSSGFRTTGPYYEEAWEWPKDDYPEMSPKLWSTQRGQKVGGNPEELRNYTGVQDIGYTDPRTGEFVVVKEMIPEIIAPDLTNFELKPYVSYRVDSKLEEKERDTQRQKLKLDKEGKSDELDEDISFWPPEPTTAKTLYKLFYERRVTDAFYAGKYDGQDDNYSVLTEKDTKKL